VVSGGHACFSVIKRGVASLCASVLVERAGGYWDMGRGIWAHTSGYMGRYWDMRVLGYGDMRGKYQLICGQICAGICGYGRGLNMRTGGHSGRNCGDTINNYFVIPRYR
jgi:hypothetical protein